MNPINKKFMYKSHIIKLVVFLSFSISPVLFAQETKTASLAFLLINTDARSGGLANNGVATSSDPNSIFHNPAKMIYNESNKSIAVNYVPWLSNISKDMFISSANYINKINENSSFGVDMKYFSLGKVDLRGNLGENNGTINPNEFALNGVYAIKLNEGFSMGVGLKYVHSNINSSSGSVNKINTVSANVSGFYQSPKIRFNSFDGIYRFGMNLSNLGPKVSYTDSSTKSFVPTNLKSGASFDFILEPKHKISTSLEFSNLLIPTDPNSENSSLGGVFEAIKTTSVKDFTLGVGTEYSYDNTFSFRMGFFNENESRGYRKFTTFGVGFISRNLSLDLSYLANMSEFNNASKNTARISLAFWF